ncbi:hypothetical protein NDU88_000361 [Pleurodeles waltl]|uniref:Uncharacterized protein n=1 Tax=Pleurodeles waltl TaxID=8319 RepID=A0AAV7N7Q8_PLEWA|nr:hypothetical protein NDU88_000361 [Pleurodeles waltl]
MANKGYMASKKKLQFCLTRVQYYGHEISACLQHLSSERAEANRWVTASPYACADNITVAKWLVTDCVPQIGVLYRIASE